MPTYTVYAPEGRLSSQQKGAIAQDVTRTHHDVTGAQTFFAQVLFIDVRSGDWFVGGAPLERSQLYVCGHIRAGRPPDMRQRLIEGLRDALARGAGVEAGSVWAYLVELPAAHMIEYGQVLPEPGEESTWLAGLSEHDRGFIQAARAAD